VVESVAKSDTPAKKVPYTSPSLTVYGSVRELTGGSSNRDNADGSSGMSPPSMTMN